MSTGTRNRILEAAATLYLERGRSGTTIADIARRAEVSRPTVYAQIGDLDTVAATLLEREVEVFFERLEEVLDGAGEGPVMLREGLVFTVTYARQHELLQRLLELEPEIVLERFTRSAAPLIERATELLRPRLERALGPDLGGGAGATDPERLAEILVRLALSLIVTPSPHADLDDPDDIARFLDAGMPLLGLEMTQTASSAASGGSSGYP